MRNPFKRKPKFVPESECVPAFFFKGETLVEVGFTEFTSQSDGSWSMSSMTEVDIPGEADHVIFETPVGCFETQVDLTPGHIIMAPPGSEIGVPQPMGLCRRTLAARAKLEEAESARP